MQDILNLVKTNFSYSQAGIFPANPRTLFVGNSQSHRKSERILNCCPNKWHLPNHCSCFSIDKFQNKSCITVFEPPYIYHKSGCYFPRELTNFVRRKFSESQEILKNNRDKCLNNLMNIEFKVHLKFYRWKISTIILNLQMFQG